MKRILIPFLLLAILTACTPAPAPAATPTATLLPPTITTQPTATATITPTPTPNPNDITDSLGLRSEPLYQDRTFEVEERSGATYLVDTYNNAPKAVLEGGAWRALDYENPADAEVMYGGLVPEGGEYIDPGMEISANVLLGRPVEVRYLGDWEVEEVEYKGETIHLYHLLGGLRDKGGVLHVVRLAWDAPDAGPEHWTKFGCRTPENADPSLMLTPGSGWVVMAWNVGETLPHLSVGERMGFYASERNYFSNAFRDSPSEIAPEMNNAAMVLAADLYNGRPELYRLSAAERAALAEGVWPDRVVTLALPGEDGFVVGRDSFDDCYR